MTKLIIIFFICLLSIPNSYSQAPVIDWQNAIGGSAKDELYSIIVKQDGSYILAGNSFSDISGDKNENHIGSSDYWIMNVLSTGEIIWQKTIGGSNSEFLTSIKETNDKGFIIAGYSRSGASGHKSEGSIGGVPDIYDYWVVKTDSIGNVQWENTIGSNDHDYLHSVDIAPDGSYYLGGYSASNSFADKSENSMGGFDYWIIKLDTLGNILWENTIGGSDNEYLYSIAASSDGGCLLGGHSSSGISGDKSQISKGFNDYWVVKLDSEGNISWQKTIGGSLFDYLTAVQQTYDGGYILGGYSLSGVSGDKTESNHGSDDYWVIKIDNVGNIIWQNTINANNVDQLKSIQQTLDGGYILGGYSKSGDLADKTQGARGGYDYWIVKLSSTGAVQWDRTLGGVHDDKLYSVRQDNDGNYILGGMSLSGYTGDKTEITNGVEDFWVIRLAYCIQEVCNGIDDDCDGLIDDADSDVEGQLYWYSDIDEDTYGSIVHDTLLCYQPLGFIPISGDCNDFDSIINPLAMEIINGIDDNCDGITDVLTDIFFQSEYIELAINPHGIYGTYTPPPLAFHPNYMFYGDLRLGIIADTDKDGWMMGELNYCGDYVLPGEPIEGWAIELGENIWYNANPLFPDIDIPGSNTFYEKNDEKISSSWNGSIEEIGLEVTQKTELGITNLYFITTVTLRNTGLTNMIDLYYLRTIDPDQEVIPYLQHATNNQILSNPPLDQDAVVISEGLTYGCFLGMGARNDVARASFGDFGIIDHIPSEVWQGLGNYELEGSDAGDFNNSIVFKIPFIAIGDSAQIAFAHIFSFDEMENALEATVICNPSPELCNSLDDNCNGLIDDAITETISISAGGPITFCQGGNVLLTATYSGATVQWKKNGTNIPGATSPTYLVTTKGTYTCETTSACDTELSTGIFVNVQKNPPASITAGGATTFCAGGSVILTANAGGGLSYQWYKGATLIPGATSLNYTATIGGNYKCRVTKTATGCFKNSNVINVSVPCKEGESISENRIHIYPNPSNENITISFDQEILLKTQLTIVEVTGKIVKEFYILSNQTDINISEFAAGVYFIQGNINGIVYSEIFVKE